MKQENETRQIHENTTITKDEMEAELKNLAAAKAKSKFRKRICVISVCTILIAAIAVIGWIMVRQYIYNEKIEAALINYQNTNDHTRRVFLGEFTDIQHFTKDGQELVIGINKGIMRYWITPTKSLSKIAVIDIDAFKSGFYFEDDSTTFAKENKYVGPQIYIADKQWAPLPKYSWVSNDNSGWQPAALYYWVDLTPKAREKWHEIQAFLMKGAIKSDGENWTFADGSPVSEREKELFKKHIAPAYMEE